VELHIMRRVRVWAFRQ